MWQYDCCGCASQRPQRAQLLEQACGRGQQLLMPPKGVVQVHVHLR